MDVTGDDVLEDVTVARCPAVARGDIEERRLDVFPDDA